MLDKDEKLTFKELTETELICEDCIHQGNLYGYPVSKCEMYKLKPFDVLGFKKEAKCEFYEKF